MSRKSKSKRFTQQGADSVKKHDERFPYRSRLSDANEKGRA
ncbi:competence protein [Aquibacillus salsiterrae]|uniref:Competence protein n=1 Tax=Aquibacillus salsiterrae TaxID=2950439 RepID=A0A9X3WGW5_9BACI|nr:competence protein [Aquibacillus salsiterrae]MDC3417224.1 competence protein [Aquibacillus salsiterrae]